MGLLDVDSGPWIRPGRGVDLPPLHDPLSCMPGWKVYHQLPTQSQARRGSVSRSVIPRGQSSGSPVRRSSLMLPVLDPGPSSGGTLSSVVAVSRVSFGPLVAGLCW